MNSLILCEGKTDCVLLQYYLEKVYSWIRKGKCKFNIEEDCWSNQFTNNQHNLIISETKGCSKLAEGLNIAIKRNINASPVSDDDFFDKIIIFTDNDETDTITDFMDNITNVLNNNFATCYLPIKKDKWNTISVTSMGEQKEFELYVMFVPFEGNGALETYLLKCLAASDEYDKMIINEGNAFIDSIDTENRYLKKRRLRTKAKFDVYFSVRTSAEQYAERQSILKSIPWEKYELLRNDFKVFADLSNKS